MAGTVDSELNRFHQFISEQLRCERAEVSPEEALDLWRMKHPMPALMDETVSALEEAIRDMEEGDEGIPIEDFDREFRRRHGLEEA